MYELTGTIKVIFDKQAFNSGFTKRDFVVTTEDRYPQDIKLECVKERCEMLDSYQQGDRVTVSFDLRGNEYKERYYVNLQAWRIAKTEEGAAAPEDQIPMEEPPFPDEGPMPF